VRQLANALATFWAIVKFVVAAFTAPFGVLAVMLRALGNYATAKAHVREFPSQVSAIRLNVAPPPPNDRIHRWDGSIPTVVVSDLHHTYAGARDWPAAQETKALYTVLLDHYDRQGWRVVENGDIEDFWMVGGSPYGQWYDAARVVTKIVPFLRSINRALMRRHLRLIVENNAAIYERLARLGEAGRLVRTVGNHDDVGLDREIAANLSETLGGAPVVDYVVLTDADNEPAAVITHGHQTDGWNAPTRSGLGQFATWVACTISDMPGLEAPETKPAPALTEAFLRGALPNVLLQVNTRFGTNSKYDSLDEELLFDAFGGAAESGPWLLLGHTHLPVLQPMSRSGVAWARYANSGSGIWWHMITALEWDPSNAAPTLVGWVLVDDTLAELIPANAVVEELDGMPVARVVMRRGPSGLHLVIDEAATGGPPARRSELETQLL
jgi:hypothetical protein